jgi:hypothetical protein
MLQAFAKPRVTCRFSLPRLAIRLLIFLLSHRCCQNCADQECRKLELLCQVEGLLHKEMAAHISVVVSGKATEGNEKTWGFPTILTKVMVHL